MLWDPASKTLVFEPDELLAERSRYVVVVTNGVRDASGKKLHAVLKGYYEDNFIQLFARDSVQMNAPLMNRGQWVRVKAVEYAVSRFAASHAGSPIQVVSVGCGMDTLFFRWAQAPLDGSNGTTVPIARFLEVDVPSMVKAKQQIIQGNATLSKLAATTNPSGAEVYKLHECDITDLEQVKAVFGSELDPALPTLLVAECVFVYFRAETSSAFLSTVYKDIFKGAKHLALLMYDAIQPNDRFGQMMIQNLGERGIELKGIHDLPTLQAHADRCKSLGFTNVRAQTMSTLHNTVPIEIRTHLNKVEMIDDWDEWEIIMGHYAVVFATPDERPEALPRIFA